MGRLLAIDYGTKRTGLAVTDPLKIIATGLTTVPTHTLLTYLKEYFNRESIEEVIIGMPKKLNNESSENMKNVKIFISQFIKNFPDMPIIGYDERFTSALAQKSMIEGGLKKKDRQNKALIDEISATIILQDYMESLIYKNKNL
ncbi:Holliday junction resolvase RuvX [Dysgonomonas macrotermitis]|uniref:Putative pre-16S rRNA nuclease n=1 Tax=Dysgonomonas macrotermitis TaxID=1346286 RepID=A0A1M5DET7_9BACT|nr:Holliday junction resolvase RuvX [Dysgonomonas macrotermitis]SHF65588.1 putative holliday junction resolvase [Dysgonomonas macrotermitis]